MHHHQNIHRHTIRHLQHNINLNITDRPTMVTMVIMDIMDIMDIIMDIIKDITRDNNLQVGSWQS